MDKHLFEINQGANKNSHYHIHNYRYKYLIFLGTCSIVKFKNDHDDFYFKKTLGGLWFQPQKPKGNEKFRQ